MEQQPKDYKFDTSTYAIVGGPVRCAECGALKQRDKNTQSANECWLTKLSLSQFGYTGKLKDEVITLNKELQKLREKLHHLRHYYDTANIAEFEKLLKEGD